MGILGSFILMETGWALTPLELKKILDQGDDVTLIDIRSTALYTQGHIQNAINIPASLIPMKRVPGFGPAIVYGDGIRTDITKGAVEDLNRLNGIQVQVLEGGFAAWESLNFTTTRAKGLNKRRFHYLSYQDLKSVAADNKDVVFLDMRSESERLTDLSTSFPGLSSIRVRDKSQRSSSKIDKQRKTRHERLYILIDDGNGESEKMAKILMAKGVGRLAIMTGGERMLRREGRSSQMKKVTVGEVEKHQ